MPASTANSGPGSPLTDAELDRIERTHGDSGDPWQAAEVVQTLVAEVRRLRTQVAGLQAAAVDSVAYLRDGPTPLPEGQRQDALRKLTLALAGKPLTPPGGTP